MITLLVFVSSTRSRKVENSIPKPLVRIFAFLTFVLPIIILPFTEGPKMAIPTIVAVTVGIFFLGLNLYLKIIAHREIGISPALKSKTNLITTGVYVIIRNPLYFSNVFLAIGMAVLFKSGYVLLFSLVYSLFFWPIIYLEERDLLKKYGEEYKKYQKNTKWRMIPYLF
jgi:protein-S-isoprenylcysteine O-methyltransferase Ste14